MANIFVNIPVPAGNGSGAPVDMTAFGGSKTISVAGPFVAAINFEISNELVPTKWAPAATFLQPGGQNLNLACHWMRATVTNFKSGVPVANVGGTDDGALFASLPVPAGNGVGAAVDVSALGLFKTVTVGGPFRGNVQLEVSEDGITKWSQIDFGFPTPDQNSDIVAAHYMRATRTGVPTIDPGLPIVDVGGCSIGTAGPAGPAGPPGPPGPPGPATELAIVTVRITDDTTGTVVGGSQTIFASGQGGSISLLEVLDDVADDGSNFTLEIKVSAGTVRVRPATQPDSESAALAVNNVATGSFLQNANTELGVDFSTASAAFVTLLNVNMTPVAATSVQVFASINFTWVP